MSSDTATDAAPTSGPGSEPGTGHDHGHRHLGIALAVICTAQLMVVLDASIVNIALKQIQKSLSFSDANLSWVVNAYTLAFGGLLLLGGRAGDLLGRRRVFMGGVGLFTLASFFGGLAQSEGQLLAARVLQGLGAALASPSALSLVTTTFPAGPARNRAFGVYAAMSGVGAAVGLILGGVLTEWNWRTTLFVNVPIGLAVLVLAPRFLGESERSRGGFDLPGAITGTAGLVSLVYGLTHAATADKGRPDWGNTTTIGALVLGAVLLAAFLVIESRSRHALLPFRILQSRPRAVSYVSMLIVGAAMFAMFYFLSLFLQGVLHYSPIKAGFAFLPFTVGLITAAQLASALMTRVDPRWTSGAGGVLAALAMLGLTRLDLDSGYVTGLLPSILMLSFGMGLIFVPLTLTAVHGVRREDSGVGSAVLNTVQQVGGAVGLATMSTVAFTAATDKAGSLIAAMRRGGSGAQPTPDQAKAAMDHIALVAQTAGSRHAFAVAAGMLAVATLLILVGLNVRHQELASDDATAPAHAG